MQDRYAGDMGDFGKLGLLKYLILEGFRVGVNWYNTAPPKSEMSKSGAFIQDDGKHKIKPKYFPCDPVLAERLLCISQDENRSIAMIQNAALLDEMMVDYYDASISVEQRAEWHELALQKLGKCDVVFLDPDNGLLVKSVGKKSAKSVKYVFEEELEDYLRSGKSVVLYSHRQRKPEEKYFAEILSRFETRDALKGKKVCAISFPKGTVRDYFLIASNEDHASKMERAITKMEQSLWGKLKLCRISIV